MSATDRALIEARGVTGAVWGGVTTWVLGGSGNRDLRLFDRKNKLRLLLTRLLAGRVSSESAADLASVRETRSEVE